MSEKAPLVVQLNDAKEYQRLYQAPETCGMKAGRVWLEPGDECGVHTTGEREETLVFLQGHGTAHVEGKQLAVGAGRVCYIPPETEHNIVNSGDEPLAYVFIVAPAGE